MSRVTASHKTVAISPELHATLEGIKKMRSGGPARRLALDLLKEEHQLPADVIERAAYDAKAINAIEHLIGTPQHRVAKSAQPVEAPSQGAPRVATDIDTELLQVELERISGMRANGPARKLALNLLREQYGFPAELIARAVHDPRALRAILEVAVRARSSGPSLINARTRQTETGASLRVPKEEERLQRLVVDDTELPQVLVPVRLFEHQLEGIADESLRAQLIEELHANEPGDHIDMDRAQMFSPALLAEFTRAYDDQLFELVAQSPFPYDRVRADLTFGYIEAGLRAGAAGRMAELAAFQTQLPVLFGEDVRRGLSETIVTDAHGRELSVSAVDDPPGSLLIRDAEYDLSVVPVRDGPSKKEGHAATGYQMVLRKRGADEPLSDTTYWTRTRLEAFDAILGHGPEESSPAPELRERFEMIWFDSSVQNRAVEMLAAVVDRVVGEGTLAPELSAVGVALGNVEKRVLSEHLERVGAADTFLELAKAAKDPEHPWHSYRPRIVVGLEALEAELQSRSRVGPLEIEIPKDAQPDSDNERWLVFEPNRYLHAVSLDGLARGQIDLLLRRSDEARATAARGRGETVRVTASHGSFETDSARSHQAIFAALIGLDRMSAEMPAIFDSPDVELARLLELTGHGQQSVAVGVIDASFEIAHPALLAHWAVNRDEIASNGKDCDHNGYGGDLYGWDMAAGRPQLDAPQSQNTRYHGTHTAALVARGSDAIEVIPARAWGDRMNKAAITSAAIEAIDYEVSRGARIISMSFDVRAKVHVDEVEAAMRRHPDVLFLKAAGNNGGELAVPLDYSSANFGLEFLLCEDNNLAARQIPNMLVVGGVDADNAHWSASNFSAKTVGVAARATDVLSAVPMGKFARHSGTSFATPQVANLAAKIRLLAPDLTPEQTMEIIETTSTRVSGLEAYVRSGGVINSERAMQLAAACELMRQGRSMTEVVSAVAFDASQREYIGERLASMSAQKSATSTR